MKLNIVSEKESKMREVKEIIDMIDNNVYFRPAKCFSTDLEPVTALPFTEKLKLKPINKRYEGLIDSKRASVIFNNILEKYENNQFFYLQELEEKKLSKRFVKKKLTELELYIVQIIEPPPKKPIVKVSKQKLKAFQGDLEAWHNREKNKFIEGRSYYCNEEVIPLLNISELNDISDNLRENYKQVQQLYDELKVE
jgi:hypothetical protein